MVDSPLDNSVESDVEHKVDILPIQQLISQKDATECLLSASVGCSHSLKSCHTKPVFGYHLKNWWQTKDFQHSSKLNHSDFIF